MTGIRPGSGAVDPPNVARSRHLPDESVLRQTLASGKGNGNAQVHGPSDGRSRSLSAWPGRSPPGRTYRTRAAAARSIYGEWSAGRHLRVRLDRRGLGTRRLRRHLPGSRRRGSSARVRARPRSKPVARRTRRPATDVLRLRRNPDVGLHRGPHDRLVAQVRHRPTRPARSSCTRPASTNATASTATRSPSTGSTRRRDHGHRPHRDIPRPRELQGPVRVQWSRELPGQGAAAEPAPSSRPARSTRPSPAA